MVPRVSCETAPIGSQIRALPPAEKFLYKGVRICLNSDLSMAHQGKFSRGRRLLTSLAIAGLWVVAATANAASSINYGNFGPINGYTFLQVTESSGTDPVPLYGPPTPFSIGLDFNPMTFTSVANGGSNDLTDGQLNFSVQGAAGIDAIQLFESGDYTLAGIGTSATQAFAGASMRITVTQIDGVNVAPIALSPVNMSVAFNLAANPGVVKPWSITFAIDIDAALTALGRSFNVGATKVDVVINNALGAVSEPGSIAFIAKKDFQISIVPEPSTIGLLLSSGLAGLVLLRRQRR